MQLDVYVAVNDLDQSVEFYSRALQLSPALRKPGYAAFDIGGGRLGLMAAAGYAVPVQRGNSAVPTIKVGDLAAWHRRIEPLAPKTTAIIDKGPMRVFMFLDPDGNVIEIAGQHAASSSA